MACRAEAQLTVSMDHDKWTKKWFDKLLPNDTSFVSGTDYLAVPIS